jgi:4-amino-4-deoxy-L-arabinose transferase-like glycosyltransferase
MNRWGWTIAVALLLAAFAALTINASVRESATYDETAHLPAGYSYLRWADYRLNPEHPPLVKQLCALPLLALPVWPDSPEFAPGELRPITTVTTRRAMQEAWALALADNGMQWMFGHLFLYGLRDEKRGTAHPLGVPTTQRHERSDFLNDPDRLLFWGRLPVTVLGVLLGLVIFAWARDLFGNAGGLLALALYCFDPNFIAHAGLVTTDVGAALFIAATVYFLWRTCERRRLADAALAALCCALAFAAKFTAVILLPVFALLGAWFTWRHRRRWWQYAALVLGMLLASWGGLWAVYGFRYSSAREPELAGYYEARLQGTTMHAGKHPVGVVRHSAATRQLLKQYPDGPPAEAVAAAAPTAPLSVGNRVLLFAARNRLLPESYLFGFAWAEMKSLVRSAYLRGQHSNTGFWNYFLWTFLLKTPVLTLLAFAAAVAVVVWQRRPVAVWLLVPPVVHLALSMTSNMNIGHRHLLPLYPFLFVLAGGLATVWAGWAPRVRQLTAGAALAGIVAGAFVVWWEPAWVQPHPLAYFNELAGGPKRGAENLVDSNLDWGQDLPALKRWLDEHHVREPIAFCYFGMASPVWHGIPCWNLPGGYVFAPPAPPPARGYLVVSATNRKGVYLTAEGRAFWDDLLRRATLVDTVGYSLFIYRLEPAPH